MSEHDATAHEGVDATETETDATTPEVAAEEPEEVSDTDEAEPEGDEGGEGQTVEEVEYDLGGGQKLKVPANATAAEVFEAAQKAFKDVEANYTRKQQAVAEQAKSIQARAEAVQKLETLNGEALQEYSKGLNLRSELERLNAINLGELWQSNPDQARRISDMKAQLGAEFQATVAKVAQLEAGMTQAQQAEMARIEAEGVAALEKRVKGFSQKVPEIIDYVSSTYGIDKDHAAKVWKMDPATAEMAYKAMMFDRMQTKAAKPATPAQAKPVTSMKARGNSGQFSSDLNNMPMDQFAKTLTKQLYR